MKKRALLLAAAAIALFSGPALAASNCDTTTITAYCDITTVITSAVTTSTVNNGSPDDIFIETVASGKSTPAGVQISSSNATVATTALKIDSDNNVTNEGTISNKDTPYGVGVEINAGQSSTDTTTVADFYGTLGTIDLSGAGTTKTGVLLDLPTTLGAGIIDATATTPADINNNVVPGIDLGTVTVVGDDSYGVHMLTGVTLEGPLLIDGAVGVTSSTKTAGTATDVTGVEIDGNIVGDLSVNRTGLGGSIVAAGPGSRGLVVLGTVDGSISNFGTIDTLGAAPTSSSSTSSSTTKTSTTGNPMGGSAFVLAGSVSHGIYNGGPVDPSDVGVINAALIVTQGSGPAALISPSQGPLAVPLNIGLYTNSDGTAPADPGFDFYNRGQITAQPPNVDTSAIGMEIVGAAGTPVTFQGGTIGSDPTVYSGGILNSGLIGATVSTDTNAVNPAAATGLWIGNYVDVPVLVNTSEVGAGHGNITASVSGASPGQAIALLINCGTGTSCNPATDGHGELDKLYNSGTISATATSTDTKTAFLTAIAIDDKSGTLSYINNSGTISATACATPAAGTCVNLDNYTAQNRTQTYTAAYLEQNTTGIDFENSGHVGGDIFFGSGDDILNVTGTGASVIGNISFFGGHDTLNVGDTDTVSGAVLERGGGYVNVTVGTTAGGTGTLIVNNTDFANDNNNANGTMQVGTLDVKSGGTLGISLSQGFNQEASGGTHPILVQSVVPATGLIHLESGAILDITFGSFVSTPSGGPAEFVLFDAPTIAIDNSFEIKNSINATIPFMFTGGVCGYGVLGFDTCSGSAPSEDQLIVSLQPKTAAELNLSGYAAQIFPYANVALANDNPLGASIIQAGHGLDSTIPSDVTRGDQLYQNLYSQFAPDVSGGARAIAISLTDQATSVIGAHQRELRMYAGKESAATLWGQEFVQRFDNATNNPNGYRDSGFGFALGADGGTPADGRYGGAFTFFSGDILEKVPAQVKTSTEWYMLSGYTDWRGRGLFFDSQLTVGYGSLRGRRNIYVDDKDGNRLLTRTASDRRASLMAAGGFSGGAVFNWGTLVAMPQFSTDVLTLRENGYTETGGGDGMDLAVQPYYTKSWRGYVGSTFREDVKIGSVYLQPEVRIGYRYDFLADPVKLKVHFAADPLNSVAAGQPFQITGPDPAKGNFVFGAGLSTTTANWSIGLSYDLVSGGGLTQHTGVFTLVGRL